MTKIKSLSKIKNGQQNIHHDLISQKIYSTHEDVIVQLEMPDR